MPLWQIKNENPLLQRQWHTSRYEKRLDRFYSK